VATSTKKVLYEEIVEQMLDCIKKGEWKPGDRLPKETDLAARFQVSRNCMREALKALNLYGVIQSRAGRGTFVTLDALRRISNTEMLEALHGDITLMELLETRLLIESQIAGLAALRATPADKAELTSATESLCRGLEDCIQQELSYNPSDLGASVHTIIAKMAHNRLLFQFMNSIQSELDIQRGMVVYTSEEAALIRDDHWRIHDAIQESNVKNSIQAMRTHIENTHRILRRLRPGLPPDFPTTG